MWSWWRNRKSDPAASTAFRITRGVKYLAFAVAALISFFYPSTVIAASFARWVWLIYLWSSVLFLGAVSCLAGILSRTWVGEYIGLWGVTSAISLYALGCFTGFPGYTGQRVVVGFIFLGAACSTIARHQDVVFQKRLADYENRLRDEQPGL